VNTPEAIQAYLDQVNSKIRKHILAREPDRLRRYAIGKRTPQLVAFPASIEALSTLLACANQQKLAVILWGAGNYINLGNPPAKYDIAIDMTGLDQVVSYDVDNFSITVQAGITLSEIQKTVAANNQFLPLDPPGLDTATAGGVVAANASGLWRLSYGAARDLVLGIKAVLPDGRIISFGGKTMKNVAGYDVTKLFIGSLGTLGAVCEVTFRLFSKQEAQRLLLISSTTSAQAFAIASKAKEYSVGTTVVLDPAGAKKVSDNPSWLTVVDLMGDSDEVEIDSQEICRLENTRPEALQDDDREKTLHAIRGLLKTDKTRICCKATVPITDVEKTVADFHVMLDKLNIKGYCVSCPGTGRIWARLDVNEESVACQLIKGFREKVEKLEGYLVVESAPDEWKPALNVWGQPPKHLDALRQIKQVFDPNGILSPGRFVGDI